MAGIYIFKPSIFDHIPDDTYYGMDDLIQNLLSIGIKISKYEIKEYWLDIGKLDDYSKAQEAYNKHFKGQ